MLSRREFLSATFASAALLSVARAANDESVATRTIRVPLDHDAPRGPSIELTFFIVGEFRRERPTLFIIADGQQFYVRAETLPSYRSQFGPEVNLIGIPGRGAASQLLAVLGDPATGDWASSYGVLQYKQWLADIDCIRRDLVGRTGAILVYGVSGGGQLAHLYLASYGEYVTHCYTEAAVFHSLQAELGVVHDRFWEEIGAGSRKQLLEAIAARPHDRDLYAQLLQRQNFFVERNRLAVERAKLIDAIARNDSTMLQETAERYQVRALNDMMLTPRAWAIRVRLYEFVTPLLGGARSAPFEPDIENSMLWARPLLALRDRGVIPTPAFDLSACRRLNTDVVVVAGRHDHTCHYLSQVALAYHYPNHYLLMLNDDHRLRALKESGAREPLLQAWPKGIDSLVFRRAVKALEGLRWRDGVQAL